MPAQIGQKSSAATMWIVERISVACTTERSSQRARQRAAFEIAQAAPQPDVAGRRVLRLQTADALQRRRDVEIGALQQQLPIEHRTVDLPRATVWDPTR